METTEQKYTSKKDADYLLLERVHTNPCISSNSLSFDYKFISYLFHQKYDGRKDKVQTESLLKELATINQLKNDLFEFLQIPVINTDLYKKQMKTILFDNRIKYSPLRSFDNYDRDRRYWRENQFHLIGLDLLKTEYNAINKLYKDLFTESILYSVRVSIPNNKNIEITTVASSKEEAFNIISNLPPFVKIDISDIYEKVV